MVSIFHRTPYSTTIVNPPLPPFISAVNASKTALGRTVVRPGTGKCDGVALGLQIACICHYTTLTYIDHQYNHPCTLPHTVLAVFSLSLYRAFIRWWKVSLTSFSICIIKAWNFNLVHGSHCLYEIKIRPIGSITDARSDHSIG